MKQIILIFIFLFTSWLLHMGSSASAQGLTLERAVSLALANNPEVKALELEIGKTKAQSVIARSTYLPQISLSANATHYFQRPVFFGFGEQTGAEKISYARFGGNDQLSAGVLFDQAILNPQAFPTFRHAKLKEQESAIILNQKQVQLVAQVKQTYLQLLILVERIKLKQQNLDRNRKVLNDSRVLLAQGKALRVDTLRAYMSVKNLEPEQLRLKNELETGKLRLAAYIAVDTIQDIVPADSLIIPIPENLPDESEVFEIASRKNPRLQQLILQESLYHQSVRQISSQRLPVFSLTGQYLLQSQTNDLAFQNIPLPATSYVGVRLAIPIFSGFALGSRVQQAMLQEEQSLLAIENEQKNLRAEVHRLVSDYNETLERIGVAKGVSETAKLTFDIVQYRYSKGVASRLELADTELALTEAQSNYLEAIYDYLMSRINLLALMGQAE